MARFLKPIPYFRCEICKAEFKVTFDSAGNDIVYRLCKKCHRPHWLDGWTSPRPLGKRVRRMIVGKRLYPKESHSHICGCVRCQSRYGRGLPPAVVESRA